MLMMLTFTWGSSQIASWPELTPSMSTWSQVRCTAWSTSWHCFALNSSVPNPSSPSLSSSKHDNIQGGIWMLMWQQVLVDVCLHHMLEELCIFLENLSVPYFSRLMEAARRTNESVSRTLRSLTIQASPYSMIRLAPKKSQRSGPVRG